MLNCLAVGIGGFIGSVLRYLAGLIPIKHDSAFSINTLLINIVGAFVIGIVATYASHNSQMNEKLLLMLKVGLCGGFTTFSTFSNETLGLIQSGKVFMAILYALLSVILCLLGVFVGQVLIRCMGY